MWQRFVKSSRGIVFYAQEEAAARGETDVAAEHLLLGLLRGVISGNAASNAVWPPAPTDRVDPDNIAASLFEKAGVDLETLQAETHRQIDLLKLPAGKGADTIGLTTSAKCVIDAAYAEARRVRASCITPEFLLLGLLDERLNTARLLAASGLEREPSRHEVANVYQCPEQDPKPSLWSRFFAKQPSKWG